MIAKATIHLILNASGVAVRMVDWLRFHIRWISLVQSLKPKSADAR